MIDLTHGIPPQAVRRGAIVLARSTAYMPEGSVFLAVVDPGVGSDRRPVALATVSGAHLVGPDNGLLSLASDELGGPTAAVQIAPPGVIARTPSATFHGRDVFAPAAAALANGADLGALGAPVDPSSLTRVGVPEPRIIQGSIRAEVLGVDRFGNLELALEERHLAEAGLPAGQRLLVTFTVGHEAVRSTTFADVAAGGLGVIVDSWGTVAVVRNRGSAAALLGASEGDELVLSRPAPKLPATG